MVIKPLLGAAFCFSRQVARLQPNEGADILGENDDFCTMFDKSDEV
jgi:hypothetical protein